jgi:hypothetical protein
MASAFLVGGAVSYYSMKSPPITIMERRSLGRFDTPRPLAQALADWAVCDANETVLEPSCGGGVLVKSVIARLSELGARYPASNLCGCDIDPRALAETQNAVAPHKPKLVLGNFLALPASALGDSKFNVILGNPPYVRLHTMSMAMRLVARQALPSADLLDAKASLWAYFPIHAFSLLADGGRMGWILPETVLHAEYGKQILQWAAQRFARCIAVSIRERCFTADGAKERIVLLLLQTAGQASKRSLELAEFSTTAQAIAALPHLVSPRSRRLPGLNGHAVPHLISAGATTIAGVLEQSPDLKRFGEVADVKIGVVTGNNGFFVMSEDERLSVRVSRRHFRPVVSKFADLGEGLVLCADREDAKSPAWDKWLLCPHPKSVDRRLSAYLRRYKRSEIASNRTMAKRSHWQVPLLGQVPEAFFRYMGQYGPRMVLNEAGYICTNTIHCIYFKGKASKSLRRAICLSLHSSYSQLSAEFEGRQYGSGVLKLEPSEAKRIAFPFSKALVTALSRAWPKLVKDAAERGWETIVPKLDRIIAEHCPNLVRSLPLEKVHTLLGKVRQRRTNSHLGTGV